MQLMEKGKNLTGIVARVEVVPLILSNVQGIVKGSRKDSHFCWATLTEVCLRYKSMKGPNWHLDNS